MRTKPFAASGQGLGFGVWGLGFGVLGFGFWVWGLGFLVWGLGLEVMLWFVPKLPRLNVADVAVVDCAWNK